MRLVTALPVPKRRQMGIVADGDSITEGYACATGFRYTDVSQRYFAPGFGTLTNIAIIGELFTTMLANLSTAVIPLITAAHAAGQVAVCFCAGGVNDVIQGASAAAVFASATSYFEACKAAGADFCVGWTLLPHGGTGAVLSNTYTYNNLLRANYKAIGIDVLVDAATEPQLIVASTGLPNSQLSPDQTHWNQFGHSILADHFAPAILSLQGSRPYLTSASASSGTSAGGTTVTLYGSGLTGVVNVAFSGINAASFTVVSDSQIQAVTGAAWATGTGEIAVMGPPGRARLPGAWSYF